MSPRKRMKRAWRGIGKVGVSHKSRSLSLARWHRARLDCIRQGSIKRFGFADLEHELAKQRHDQQHPGDLSRGTLAYKDFSELMGYITSA